MRDFDKEIDALERRLQFVRQEKEKETYRRDSVQQVSNALSTILNQNPLLICPDLPSFQVHERSVYTFGMPRGFGKTSFVLDRVRRNQSKFYTIIWVPNKSFAERIIHEESDINLSRCLFISGDYCLRQLNIHEPIGEILIDEYEYMPSAYLRQLYDCVCHHNAKFGKNDVSIVRVGTPKL